MTHRPLRSVLHVAQPTTAGVARVAADLVENQVARGWRVMVACPDNGDLPGWTASGGGRHLSWTATRSPGPGIPEETRRLAALVADVAPDLVHLHSSKAGLAGRLALRGRLPTVFQPHAWSFLAVTGPVRTATLGWERWAARWCDVIAHVSDDERRLGEAAGVRARWARTPNGVDVDRLSPAGTRQQAEARRVLDLPDGPLAVCLGRLCRQKGQDLLLQAWPDVVRQVPGATLVLVGDGPDREVLRAAAGSGVLFPGAAAEVTPWLTAADVVVLPSRWEAGLSLVAMEAMARSRCVVVSDVAGMREGIGTDAGAVVPVDDVPALTAAVARRLADPVLAEIEGRAGRRRVEDRHDLRRTAEQMASVYDEVLTARTRDSAQSRR